VHAALCTQLIAIDLCRDSVGLHNFNPVDPWRLKPHGFNP
jgi:hypothetical protein